MGNVTTIQEIRKKSPEFSHLLGKMIEIAGYNPEEVLFDENWFLKHEYSKEDEEEFIKYAKDYLYNNKKARLEIMKFPRKDKKNIEKAVSSFILMYGLKTK